MFSKRRRSTASTFLPLEHGSWSLALEPLALAMLVAPSSAGVALTASVLAAFFARRPFKTTMGRSSSEGPRPGRSALILFTVLASAGLGETLLLARPAALWPLLLTVPCGTLFVYFDTQGESRAAAAELAGSAAFALLPVALATLAGWRISAALALATLSLARSLPTVLTVRTYLRLQRAKPAAPLIPLLVAALALGAILLFTRSRLAPWLAVCSVVLLLVRAGWLLGSWRPTWTARRIGLTEALVGLLYVMTVAFAYHTEGRFLSLAPA